MEIVYSVKGKVLFVMYLCTSLIIFFEMPSSHQVAVQRGKGGVITLATGDFGIVSVADGRRCLV
jgi:hypothetical protein